jgi:hypothetical protein
MCAVCALSEALASKAPRPGTLGGLIKTYFETEHFKKVADATKRDYRKCADFLHPTADSRTPGFQVLRSARAK